MILIKVGEHVNEMMAVAAHLFLNIRQFRHNKQCRSKSTFVFFLLLRCNIKFDKCLIFIVKKGKRTAHPMSQLHMWTYTHA